MLKLRHTSKKVTALGKRYVSYKSSLIFVVAFAVLGTLIVVLTHASVPTASVESESGTVSGGAQIVTDSRASNSAAVQFSNGAYNPDPYCWYHVMGSLFGDDQNNGAANGAGWDPNDTSWSLFEPNDAVQARFNRCAQYVIDNNIGGNGTATIKITPNAATKLTNFYPAGHGVPFPDDSTPQPITTANSLQKRAFAMSVLEGEGEKCDPVTTACPTGQFADNYKTVGGQTNPTYYLHLTTLQPIIQSLGLTSAFMATGGGCTPQTLAQLQAGNGGALCIKASDYPVIATWPVAACNRVPGYGQINGYQCGLPDAP